MSEPGRSALEPGGRLVGTTLGHFRITAKLGEGGMGEVWRAEDSRLGREVAIKVLPDRFLADRERLARFEREARVLASLSHPHVAGIFEVGEQDGVHFLVMELVTGETLAERIARGALPPGEAVGVALQIAEALEAAHERGIVHRDLKPANVKIEPGGRVKVLDFGLAKALEPEPGSSSASALAHSPTLTHQATQAGMLMGTAAYMSPEQARGQAADRRADIWAFGVVLFEMLTGRMAFPGETVSDTLAAVLKTDTDWALLPPGLHPDLRRLLERCLEKDPRRRLHDIADARVVLADAAAGRLAPPRDAAPTARARRRPAVLAGAALAGAAVAAVAAWALWPQPSPPPLRKTEIPVADAGRLYATGVGPAISPDGRWVAYGSGDRLWLRALDSVEAREVPGGAGAAAPFWSPDSRWIGFAVGERLWKAPVAGGSPTAIARLPEALDTAAGFAWLTGGSIVFTTGDTGLLMVPDQGGDPESVLEPAEGERDFHEAAALPGGGGVVFLVHRAEGMDTLELWAGGARKQLLRLPEEKLGKPTYSFTGHILYERETTNPGIWALPFSLTALEVTGKPFLVVANAGLPSVSEEGTLVYVAGRQAQWSRLAWMDREGRRLGDIGEPREQEPQPALSRDGTRLALAVTDGGREDLWIEDLQRGSRTRLTFDDRNEAPPEWSPDGQQVVFAVREKGGQPVLHLALTDGTGTARELGPGASPAFTPDGQGVVYAALDPETGWDVLLRSPLDAEPRVLLRADGAQYWPRIAPAGDLMAYISAESGRDEVYLTRFPGATGKWQVSVAGGDWPAWSGDGSRLYYIQTDHAVMEVEVTTSPALTVGPARRLFTAPDSGVARAFGWPAGFAVTPDGQRFIVVEPVENTRPITGLVVVQSWFEEFRGRRNAPPP